MWSPTSSLPDYLWIRIAPVLARQEVKRDTHDGVLAHGYVLAAEGPKEPAGR